MHTRILKVLYATDISGEQQLTLGRLFWKT